MFEQNNKDIKLLLKNLLLLKLTNLTECTNFKAYTVLSMKRISLNFISFSFIE